MKLFPALDLRAADDLTIAELDDFHPTAIEEGASGARIFFPDAVQRDAAIDHLAAAGRAATPVDVPDEDWAARSQQNLTPITIGRITIVPTPNAAGSESPLVRPASQATSFVITIEPSMGFGTGHHATTRLCLLALQRCDVRGATMLDVGTGSGVLAIAGARLGAARSLGIDNDADAIASAARNLPLNPEVAQVTFEVRDLGSCEIPRADIVVANITGAALVRFAGPLRRACISGGTLILCGILDAEEQDVRRAFEGVHWLDRAQESEWVCLTAIVA